VCRLDLCWGVLDRGDKDAITLLFALALNKESMKVKQKRKEIKKAGLSGISTEESFAGRQILLVCQDRSCENVVSYLDAKYFSPACLVSARRTAH
jgi:hypothetical protein